MNFKRSRKRKKNREKRKKFKYLGKKLYDLPEWRAMKMHVYKVFPAKCMKCGCTDNTITLDHIYPCFYFPELSLNVFNIQVLCWDCNEKKGTDNFNDYRTKDDVLSISDYVENNKEQILKNRLIINSFEKKKWTPSKIKKLKESPINGSKELSFNLKMKEQYRDLMKSMGAVNGKVKIIKPKVKTTYKEYALKNNENYTKPIKSTATTPKKSTTYRRKKIDMLLEKKMEEIPTEKILEVQNKVLT